MKCLSLIALVLAIAAYAFGFETAPASAVTPSALPEVQGADLITRYRGGVWSHHFANASPTDKRFSHCGIVVIVQGLPYVIHSEGSDATGKGTVRRETLAAFIAEARDWAVFRCQLEHAQRGALLHQVQVYLDQRIPFDPVFDYRDATKLYCTELIWRAGLEALQLDLCPRKTTRGPYTFLTIENLTHTPYYKEVSNRKGSLNDKNN